MLREIYVSTNQLGHTPGPAILLTRAATRRPCRIRRPLVPGTYSGLSGCVAPSSPMLRPRCFFLLFLAFTTHSLLLVATTRVEKTTVIVTHSAMYTKIVISYQ